MEGAALGAPGKQMQEGEGGSISGSGSDREARTACR